MHSVLLINSCSVLCPRIVFAPSSRSILVRIISGYSVSLRSHYSPVSPLHPLCSLGSDCGIVLCTHPISCFVSSRSRRRVRLLSFLCCWCWFFSRLCVLGFMRCTALYSVLCIHSRFCVRTSSSDSPRLDGSSDKRFCRQWVEL